jgi:hypothetical protein
VLFGDSDGLTVKENMKLDLFILSFQGRRFVEPFDSFLKINRQFLRTGERSLLPTLSSLQISVMDGNQMVSNFLSTLSLIALRSSVPH